MGFSAPCFSAPACGVFKAAVVEVLRAAATRRFSGGSLLKYKKTGSTKTTAPHPPALTMQALLTSCVVGASLQVDCAQRGPCTHTSAPLAGGDRATVSGQASSTARAHREEAKRQAAAGQSERLRRFHQLLCCSVWQWTWAHQLQALSVFCLWRFLEPAERGCATRAPRRSKQQRPSQGQRRATMSDLSARRAAVVVTPRNITATVAVVAGGCAAAAAASRAVNERPNTDMEQSQTMGFVALCLSLLLTVLALSPALMSPAESRAGSASRHAARTLCFFWYWQPRQWVDLGPWWHSDLLNVSGLALSTPLRTAWLAASAWVFVSATVILSTAVSWQPTLLSSCLIGTAPLDILLLASGISLSLAMPLGAASLRSRSAAAKEVVLAQEPAPASLFEKRRHGWLLALGMVMLWAGLRALGVVLQHAWLDQGSAALRTGVVVLAAAAEVGSFAALHGALPSSVSGAPALVRGTILLLVVLDCVALAMFGADALPLIRTLHSFALGAAVPGMQLHSSIVAWDQLHSQETRASVTVFGEQVCRGAKRRFQNPHAAQHPPPPPPPAVPQDSPGCSCSCHRCDQPLASQVTRGHPCAE